MDFKLVAKNNVEKSFRETTYPEDMRNAVNEIWGVISEMGDGYVVETEPFPTAEDARKWMAKAQAYGKTRGIFLRQARGYKPSVANALVLTAEGLDVRQQRIDERKAKAEELKARKEAGEIVKPGRKRGQKVKKAGNDGQ